MKLGIIGLSGSGRLTVFDALTKDIAGTGLRGENRIGTIHVPDKRIDILSGIYNPKKTIYAQVEYLLPGKQETGISHMQNTWTQVRDCDALIHVVRNFSIFGCNKPLPFTDFFKLDQEMIFDDLVVAEKRTKRLEEDKKRGKKNDPEELSLLNECLNHFEEEIPIRKNSKLSSARILKGYAFLSAKPVLVLFNNEDDDNSIPVVGEQDAGHMAFEENCMVIRGKLEQELAQIFKEMSEDEAAEFLAEYDILAPATDRVITGSYELLGLISFFTVGEDEVRAWTIQRDTNAVEAAGAIHTDFKKGFIRAEVVSYDDLIEAGSYQEARKKGAVRLEGKTYCVKDGDIINFRFNV